LMNSRIVFGGGGIMPDIFIPRDATIYTDYEREIIRKGVLNQFVLRYVDKNRKKMKNSYGDFNEFNIKFVVSDDLLTQLDAYAVEIGLSIQPQDSEIEREEIRQLFKAYIARDLYSNNEFYIVLNQSDKNIQKAVEVMNDWNQYSAKVLY